MRIRDWSSDVCYSDLLPSRGQCVDGPGIVDRAGDRGRLAVLRRVRRLVRGHAVRCWRLSRDMRIHILGICGTFMAGIAAIAREPGHTVTGSDATAWPPMATQPEALRITLLHGSDPAHLPPAPAT